MLTSHTIHRSAAASPPLPSRVARSFLPAVIAILVLSGLGSSFLVAHYPTSPAGLSASSNQITKHLPAWVAADVTGNVRWVEVSDSFSLPVIQQPQGNALYVSSKRGLITQFRLANQNGVTGLLAHNFLSGKEFYKLDVGQVVRVTFDDGTVRSYQVESIHRFQKLDPDSLQSKFIELGSLQEYSTNAVFDRFYRGEHHLIFQTCLDGDGRLDWGLMFVVAMPVAP